MDTGSFLVTVIVGALAGFFMMSYRLARKRIHELDQRLDDERHLRRRLEGEYVEILQHAFQCSILLVANSIRPPEPPPHIAKFMRDGKLSHPFRGDSN